MADEILKEFEGTWFNVLDPYYGYLKIEEYQGEHDGGECVAVIHAKHGETDPPIWYRGVWRPTAMGFEAIAGPYHWKNMALFDKPKTESGPYLKFFRSQLNGWGGCNMGRLPDGDEQEYVDELPHLPGWQEEKSYWKDYPSATWEESSKYVHPERKYYGPTDPPPFGNPDEAFGQGLGTSGGAGGGGKTSTKPKTNSNGDGGEGSDNGGNGSGDAGGAGKGDNGESGGKADEQPQGDKESTAKSGKQAAGSEDGGEEKDNRNAFVRGVDKATDAVDNVTGDLTKPAGDTVDGWAESAGEAFDKARGKGKSK